jgi:hypothetical protein
MFAGLAWQPLAKECRTGTVRTHPIKRPILKWKGKVDLACIPFKNSLKLFEEKKD